MYLLNMTGDMSVNIYNIYHLYQMPALRDILHTGLCCGQPHCTSLHTQ